MSMVYQKEHEGIKKALQRAYSCGIAFICSTEDKYLENPPAYPAAHFPEAISISACNNVHKLLPEADPRALYHFQGENVQATSLSYSNYQEPEVTGSSVATAVAAGVASLILSCRNLADPNSTLLRCKTVTTVFDDMVQGKGEKFVQPGNFFCEYPRRDGLVRWTDKDWAEWLNTNFGTKSKYTR
jgi:hypothetical protein